MAIAQTKKQRKETPITKKPRKKRKRQKNKFKDLKMAPMPIRRRKPKDRNKPVNV